MLQSHTEPNQRSLLRSEALCLGLGPTLLQVVFLLEIGGVGGCRGVGESGSPGPLGFGAGMIFFIRGGCSVRLFSSRSCH